MYWKVVTGDIFYQKYIYAIYKSVYDQHYQTNTNRKVVLHIYQFMSGAESCVKHSCISSRMNKLE